MAKVKETVDGIRVILFSLNGAVLPVGRVPVLSLSEKAAVVEVKAADADAMPVVVAVGENGYTDVPELVGTEDVVARIDNGMIRIYATRDYNGVTVLVNSIDGRLLYSADNVNLNGGSNVIPVDNIGNGVFLLSIKLDDVWRYIKLFN